MSKTITAQLGDGFPRWPGWFNASRLLFRRRPTEEALKKAGRVLTALEVRIYDTLEALTSHEIHVLLCLLSHFGPLGICPGYPLIAAECRISESSARRAVAGLKRKRWLVYSSAPGGRNQYVLIHELFRVEAELSKGNRGAVQAEQGGVFTENTKGSSSEGPQGRTLPLRSGDRHPRRVHPLVDKNRAWAAAQKADKLKIAAGAVVTGSARG